MFEFISKHFKNDKPPTPERVQELPPTEVAKLLREAFLDMFEYGTKGSDQRIPDREEKGAIFLPTLLGYSYPTREHWKMLTGILRAPTTYENAESGKKADVVLHETPSSCRFYFSHELMEPFFRGMISEIGQFSESQMGVYFSFMKKTGIWKIGYDFNAATTRPNTATEWDQASKLSLGVNVSTSIRPERQFLMNFFISPTQLDSEWFLDRIVMMSADLYVPEPEIRKDKFRILPGTLDPEKYLDILEQNLQEDRERGEDTEDSLTTLAIEIYEQEPQKSLDIIEIGKMKLGQLDYYVYSAAEHLKIEERKAQKATQGSPSFSGSLQPTKQRG